MYVVILLYIANYHIVNGYTVLTSLTAYIIII